MAVVNLTSYPQVQQFISQILTANNQTGDVANAPHKAFWSNLTYSQFVSGNVPGVADPNTGKPMPILVKGNSAQSNIIMALRGVGPLFDANGSYGQMPADGPPFFTDDQITSIANWIDANCPQ